MGAVAVSMHLRDVPDHLHHELSERAAHRGMTLRQYTIDVLAQHCAHPTVDDWLDRVARRRALALRFDAASAVAAGREDDDRRVG
jgi:hypothetical protein